MCVSLFVRTLFAVSQVQLSLCYATSVCGVVSPTPLCVSVSFLSTGEEIARGSMPLLYRSSFVGHTVLEATDQNYLEH